MATIRHTSISRNTLVTRNKRKSGRAQHSPDSTSLERSYRSKTPQPPTQNQKRERTKKKKKKTNKILQYRARKDSASQQEIEEEKEKEEEEDEDEELPNYVRATTPQPHLFSSNQITIKRSKSGTSMHSISSSRSPQNDMIDIPTFSPMDVAAQAHSDNSMFTFVKTQFEPQMAIIHSNININTAQIPMMHNQLQPHDDDEFNTNKIHQIPKPPPSLTALTALTARARSDSTQSTASMTPDFGALLTPKQMEAQIMSHYSESSKKTERKKSKMAFLSKIKETKPKKRKSKKRKRSSSKPFNDEDCIEEEQIFTNKLHPAYTPFDAPKSTPTQQTSKQWKNIPQITPNNNYEENEFMDDREVAAKAFAFNESLRKQEHDNKQEEYEREIDKIRFKCDQLDWNLNTLQSNTDKDIVQITAKIHRVEHDIKTQNDLVVKHKYHDSNKRRNSVFNSLESSISAVMRNVESIKDALQTLDLRMSIINQRQHEIFKHIDETKDIVHNLDNVTSTMNNNEESSSSAANINANAAPLVLNALEDKNNLISSSRRASLQSMSEMLRLRSMSISVKDRSEYELYNNINDKNPLILPTYDDNEDILHPQSLTNKKLLGHIRPELLIQHNSKNKINNVQCMISQRAQMKPLRLIKDKSHDLDVNAAAGSGIVIERTLTQQIARRMSDVTDVDGNKGQNMNKLPSIVEHIDDNDDESSDDEHDIRRTHNKHIRSSMDSGLCNNILSQIKSETMLIHSSNESDEDLFEDKHTKRLSHSRNIDASNNVDTKTLQVPITNKMTQNNKRKYSESYSLNMYSSHIKNTPTEHKIIEHQTMDKQRTASMSYDIAKEATLSYEREISRNDMDPLRLKDRTQADDDDDDDDEEDEDENDSVSDLSVDSMSDLSADGDTFVVHSDTLQQALETQEMEQDNEERKESKTNSMIQLMSIDFKLQIVPNTFQTINDFIINTLSEKPSYLFTLRNNTTSHDLFFKTSKIYSCQSAKSLIFFKACRSTSNLDDDQVIVIDSDNSEDHLQPGETVTFGDINIKKGIRYAGYFVYDAWPYLNTDSASNYTANINYKTNPITPHLKPNVILNAIDEKHNDLQFTELRLDSMTPYASTVNKYRRQSLSTANSVRRMSTEPSVTSLLGRALDEEHNYNASAFDDGVDDLTDVVIGFDIQLSVADPQLNSFKFYIQFSPYAEPIEYNTQLANRKLLKSFCNCGTDGLYVSHEELAANISINEKHSIHPQIIANISYNKSIINEPEPEQETFDID